MPDEQPATTVPAISTSTTVLTRSTLVTTPPTPPKTPSNDETPEPITSTIRYADLPDLVVGADCEMVALVASKPYLHLSTMMDRPELAIVANGKGFVVAVFRGLSEIVLVVLHSDGHWDLVSDSDIFESGSPYMTMISEAAAGTVYARGSIDDEGFVMCTRTYLAEGS